MISKDMTGIRCAEKTKSYKDLEHVKTTLYFIEKR